MTTTNDQHRPTRLYFAYGSNLNKVQMRAAADDASELITDEYRNRCPDSLAVAPFILTGHRLAFVGERTGRWGRGGVATVLPDAGSKVYGALYRISPADEATLDRMEGVDHTDPQSGSYYKATAGDYLDEPVMLYIATARHGAENPPSARYLATIRRGYEMWGLPMETLAGITACADQ